MCRQECLSTRKSRPDNTRSCWCTKRKTLLLLCNKSVVISYFSPFFVQAIQRWLERFTWKFQGRRVCRGSWYAFFKIYFRSGYVSYFLSFLKDILSSFFSETFKDRVTKLSEIVWVYSALRRIGTISAIQRQNFQMIDRQYHTCTIGFTVSIFSTGRHRKRY